MEEYEDVDDDSFGEENDIEDEYLNPLFSHRCHSSFNTRRLDIDAVARHFEDTVGDADPDVHDEKHRTALMWLASDYKSQRHREVLNMTIYLQKWYQYAICLSMLDRSYKRMSME